MKPRVYAAVFLSLLLAAGCFAQASAGYLDVFIVHVKPEKRAQFDAVSKKIADVERKSKGDYWTAAETMYGEQSTVYFVSQRANYAEVGQAAEAFYGTLAKSLGPAATAKLLQDFNDCVASSRGEMRVRRLDLSRNAPTDAAARAKAVAAARFNRTIIVRVRPGRGPEYEAQLKTVQSALERAGNRLSATVYQSVVGQQGTIYYITVLGSSLGSFDPSGPTLPEALGADGYQKYLKTTQEVVISTETIINRYLPEISNPPDSVIAAGGDFWKVKAPAAPKPKAAEKKEAAKK